MASRYWVAGGDGLWGSINNWSATDNGAGGQTVPGASDDVFFTGNSPACTVNTSNRTALTLNFTGYTNTITMSVDISVSGAMTFVAAMTITGAGYFRGIIAATHTSNGKTISNLWFSGSVTHVLADNFTVTNLRIGSTSSVTVINGNQISINGDLDRSQASTGSHSGTTNLIMAGTGSIILPSSTSILSNNLTINTTGSIALPTGTMRHNGNFTYTAGTVTNASNCIVVVGAVSTTWNTGGTAIQFSDFSWTSASSGVLTLTSSLYCNDFTANTSNGSQPLTVSAGSNDIYCRDFIIGIHATGTVTFDAGNIYISRHFSAALQTSGIVSGTATFNLNGTGNLTTDAHTTGRIMTNFVIDTTGTITIVSAVSVCNINFFKFKRVSGVVIGFYTWGIPNPIGKNLVFQNIGTH